MSFFLVPYTQQQIPQIIYGSDSLWFIDSHFKGFLERRRDTSGGGGTRTPKGVNPAVFKTAALPIRTTPPSF